MSEEGRSLICPLFERASHSALQNVAVSFAEAAMMWARISGGRARGTVRSALAALRGIAIRDKIKR